MLLLDSNILIYAVKSEALRGFIEREAPAIASISMIETLGYHAIGHAEERALRELFDSSVVIRLTESVVERAIALRQARRMSLGDSIIAATALVYDLTLATRNLRDFEGIANLKVIDPMLQAS